MDLSSSFPNICMSAVLNSEVSCIEISRNGDYVALGKDSEIQLWNYRLPEKELEAILSNPPEKSTEETKIVQEEDLQNFIL